MREIKFRAWDKKKNQMYREVYVLHPSTQMIKATTMGEDNGWMNYVERCVLMQYTGLTDKNGVEIYEGDIVGGYPHGTVFVRWSDEGACFESVSYDAIEDDEGEVTRTEVTTLLANDLSDCKDAWEVIGNIYENPELMK